MTDLPRRFVELLLIGGAHEILARSPYRFGNVAQQHAAAAGFLAWHSAKKLQTSLESYAWLGAGVALLTTPFIRRSA
jgi:hypothetical protein